MKKMIGAIEGVKGGLVLIAEMTIGGLVAGTIAELMMIEGVVGTAAVLIVEIATVRDVVGVPQGEEGTHTADAVVVLLPGVVEALIAAVDAAGTETGIGATAAEAEVGHGRLHRLPQAPVLAVTQGEAIKMVANPERRRIPRSLCVILWLRTLESACPKLSRG